MSTILVSRDTQAEWESPAGQIITASLTTDLRPDALSPDYRTAFTYGPSTIGDTSAGILSTLWRIDAIDTGSATWVITYQPSGSSVDSGIIPTSYISGALLFIIDPSTTNSVRELDFCFSTDSRPVVCVELTNNVTSSISLYWYNPIASAFELTQFVNSGSCPRVISDNPNTVTNSDVLCFFVSASHDTIRYIQQRDQYGIVYNIPLPTTASATEQLYLEDVVKLKDSRIGIYYSRRDTSTARWTLNRLETVLYPVELSGDILSSGISVISSSFSVIGLRYNATGSLNRDMMIFDSSSLQWVTSSWEQIVLSYNSGSDSLLSSSVSFVTSSMLNTLISYSHTDALKSSSVSILTASLL